ncbi:Proline--tRNA ligase protein [Marine Group I thaumarchaeote SCGC AAA799-E16]|uniref:Proline--tRNA ligase n=5 Tax=Marine Group I TaxID=905826 RepID=A0A087S9B9_9ARCH|nr:Proline--tRNA ligase protein [Marine Group I thaumarchaeote SCGC AAA799-E16]KFM16450.1 Proline--tRNA ligase protein [Marine Group I thaumarchaeote SCGC AAA799-D11]KFM18416.1 Proline--tRNA ligase protein [Marine Group I thaumarchaeote SCGC RSA3]KFM22323.1 Proline--tRNA ligase protein [Marine Group I thaumarchaeote SCGC AAA799-B03]
MSKEDVGITVSKKDDFSEWYTQVVLKAKLADYAPVKGLIVLRPDGYSIWESLKSTFDKKFAKNGIRNGFLPVLIPESLLGKEQKHFAGFNPEVFWVTHSGTNEVGDRLALRPTSETLAYTLYSKWIQSWRDLPLKINFWNTALRAEIKATKPFLRTSEFLWQEGHTVHTTQEEAEKEVMKILDIYKNTVEEELAIPVTTGKKSEKEKFVGAVYTTTMESIMPDGKALQMGTSHFLGQNFSKPFEVKFADKDNVEHFAWQTSWGVSWRLIGAMIMAHGDDQGLVLPPKVAPTQVVIVPIYRNDEGRDKVLPKVKEIQEKLESKDIRIQIDDRQGLSPGYKFNDWEMKGVPIRIEIGPKDIEKQSMVVAKRYNREKINLEFSEMEKIVSVLDEIQKNMLENARVQSKENTKEVSDYTEFKSKIEEGGFFNAPWCGKLECEEKIKEETGADIRVIPFGSENTDLKCMYCGEQSESVPIFARGY